MALRTINVVLCVILAIIGLTPPGLPQTPTATQVKKPPIGPAAPQSTHFPVLLLAVGMNPSWSLRIGPNGPERLDRPGYPPITLEPAEVTHEGPPDAWVYHAKDAGTGAAISVRLSREACSDGSAAKYGFRAIAEDAQLGTMNGCARIAAELFPRAVNPPNSDDDESKKKPVVDTTVTNFKMPVDVAYVSVTKKVVLKHATVPHVVAAEGSQLALSHDGKRLLYTREDEGGGRAIVLYEAATGKSTDLLTGDVQQAFWSPDDTRITFMKLVDGRWHLWIAPVTAPLSATSTYSGRVSAIDGWADSHTILVDDLNQLSWVGEDGTVQRTLAGKDLYGDAFVGGSRANTVRIHPLNPDLLLVSAEMAKPEASPPRKAGTGAGFFLYEIASKRRVSLSPPDMTSGHAEWSRDGLQIFLTGTDASRRTATWRIFWDGSGLKRYIDGRDLVVGQ